jgi:hypothetical protein
MEKVVGKEVLSILWVFLYLFSLYVNAPGIVQYILIIQSIISIIASIIHSYQTNGTQQRKGRRKTSG